MKKYILLFALFITAIFFYPVFAHADKIGSFLTRNSVSEPGSFLILGSGLMAAAGFIKKHIRE